MKRLLPAVVAATLACCADPSPPPPSPPTGPREAAPPPSPPRGKVTAMGLETFFALQQSGELLVYDARPGYFHQLGSIPGSVSWPARAFDKQLPVREAEIRDAAARGRTVVIYCTNATCPDSRRVAERLAARGHQVAVLEGGFNDWREAGLPVE